MSYENLYPLRLRWKDNDDEWHEVCLADGMIHPDAHEAIKADLTEARATIKRLWAALEGIAGIDCAGAPMERCAAVEHMTDIAEQALAATPASEPKGDAKVWPHVGNCACPDCARLRPVVEAVREHMRNCMLHTGDCDWCDVARGAGLVEGRDGD